MPLRLDASPQTNLIPLLAAAMAATCFIGMDSVIKLMAMRYDALQLSLFRFAGGSMFAVCLWAWKRSPLPSRAGWRLHFARSVLLLLSIVGYFHALTQLPLALAVTISYLSPIFVAALAIPVLKERPSVWIWAALGSGLTGVSIAVAPELIAAFDGVGTERLLGMASAAVAALSFAGVMLMARRQAGRDSMWTILLIQSLLPLLLLAGPAALDWRPVQRSDLALILAAGALGTLGLLCLTFAFTRLEASRVAPLEYSGFVWAVLLGYLLFGEVPTLPTLVSALMIVGGCLLLLRR
mgnify:FL=1